MQENHPRRLPVENRGQRVPGLWKRPKREGASTEGDVFEVIYRAPNGKQRQKTLKATTVQRAVKEAEEYRTLVRRREIVPSTVKFGEIAAEYFAVVETLVATGEMSDRTLKLYRQRYVGHIEPILARHRAQDIGPEHIAAIFAEQRKANLASWTIAGTKTVISAIVTFALSRGYLASNPLHRLSAIENPRPKSERKARRLSDAEVRKLCEGTTDTYRPIVTTLAWTGLRVSEALGLRWLEIDFEKKEVNVRHQLTEDGKLKSPKTAAGCRSIPLLPILEATLKAHRVNQLAKGFAGQDQFVFTTATGAPLNRHNVRNRGVIAAAEKAGLNEGGEHITTHDLRRTFISQLIVGLGLDAVRVSRIAGHENVAMTLNTYAEEFDKALHREDLNSRIETAGFGSV